MFPTTTTFLTFITLFAALLRSVSAHGWVHNITLDGVNYQGPDPYGPPISSPIWQVSSNSPASPVYGNITGPAMACGGDAQPANMTVPVTAGSNITISWAQWPHNMGPIITYLGACQGSCETTDPTTVDFFKINEADFEPGTKTWVQSQTYYLGQTYTFTLPEDVPNGDFLMRHEIIGLHNAMNVGGAEFFPNCIQVTVECGTGVIPNVTTRFPGGYSATDPGILVDVYTNPQGLNYVDPGPPITLQEDPDNGDGDTSPSTTSPATTTPGGSTTTTTHVVATPTTPTVQTTTTSSTTTSKKKTSSTTKSTTTTTSSSQSTSVSMTMQNGLDAIALNRQYATLTAGTSCNNNDIGCLGAAFGQCVWGTWVATNCPAGLVCAALPNVGVAGTSITCTTAADRDSRIALTGAASKKRRRSHQGRHRRPGLRLS